MTTPLNEIKKRKINLLSTTGNRIYAKRMMPLVSKSTRNFKLSSRVCVYYLTVIVLSLAVHAVLPSDDNVLMPRAVAFTVIAVLTALPWAFLNVVNLLYAPNSRRDLSELMTHFFFLAILWATATNIGNR